MPAPSSVLKPGNALLVVDVQVDFCPGGALAIEGGDRIVPLCNRWLAAAHEHGIPIYLSRDWHPRRHVSFQAQGGDWPPHCIQDTPGAAFHPQLEVPDGSVLVTKGVRLDKDQNSAFDETGLAVQLHRDGVTHLWVAGLALDVCVLASVLDATEHLDTTLIRDATAAVDGAGIDTALAKMRSAGAGLATSD